MFELKTHHALFQRGSCWDARRHFRRTLSLIGSVLWWRSRCVFISRQNKNSVKHFDERKCEQNQWLTEKNSSKCWKSVLFWHVLLFLGSSWGQVLAQNCVNVPTMEPLWIVLVKDWPEFPQIYPGIPSLCKSFFVHLPILKLVLSKEIVILKQNFRQRCLQEATFQLSRSKSGKNASNCNQLLIDMRFFSSNWFNTSYLVCHSVKI